MTNAPRTPRERVAYSAIVDRPALTLPQGARMVVWTIVNVEDWGIERPMPRTVLPPPMGQPLLPDLPTWAWHEYVADWVLADQPLQISTAHGPIVSVPYTVEINDIVMMLVQHHPAEEMLRRGRDHFDRLYQESAVSPRVMAISVHPYISGVPHRIRYVE